MAGKKKSDPFVRCFEVTHPTLHPKGHTIYKVTQKSIKVDAPDEDVHEIVVWRRYNDFKKLYKAMFGLHRALHRKEEFPPFARSKVFGRFDSTVLIERQQSAQDLLNFVGQRHYLVNSKTFMQFFEGGETGVVNPHGDPILQPVRLSDAGDSDSDTTSMTSSIDIGPDSNISIVETLVGEREAPEGEELPLDGAIGVKRVESGPDLGGVWKFRQCADEISLDDNDNDEDDDSEMALFDPFHPAEGATSVSDNQDGGIWLLSAMSQLQTEDGLPSRGSSASLRQLEEQLPLPPTTSPSEKDNNAPSMTGQSDESDASQVTSSSLSQTTLEKKDENNSNNAKDQVDGKADKSQIVSEFDPLKGQVGKVQCGKGDINFSLTGPSSPPAVPFPSQTSSASAQSELTNHSLQPPQASSQGVPQASSQGSPRGSPQGSRPASGTSSPARSPRKQVMKLNLTDKGAAYILQAAKQISLAQQCEANTNYSMAFTYYKAGVGLLITGVQDDENKERREVVRRKTARYLIKAEEVYNRHLATKGPDDKRWDHNLEPVTTGQLSPTSELNPGVAFRQGPASELKNFRVLGIIDKVLLVYDSVLEATHVMKVLHKSSSAPSRDIPAIVPVHCPFMVGMHKFFETESAIFLLLQHASGGKLWTYVSSYLQQQSESLADNIIFDQQTDPKTAKTSRGNTPQRSKNIYTGQHLDDDNSPKRNVIQQVAKGQGQSNIKDQDSADPDFMASPESSKSYSKLFTTTDESSNVALPTDPRLKNLQEDELRRKSNDSFLSLDGSKDPSQMQNMLTESRTVQKPKYTSMSSTEDELIVSPAEEVLSDGEAQNKFKFEELLKDTKPNIDNFSINSFDSDSGPTSRFDSTTSDYIESIPEVCEVSHHSSEESPLGDVFIGSELNHVTGDDVTPSKKSEDQSQNEAIVKEAKDLILNVDKILAEADEEVIKIASNTRDTVVSLETGGLKGEFPTSTPKKNTENGLEWGALQDSVDEPSIYDVHRPDTDGDTASYNGSIDKSLDINEPKEDTEASSKPKSLDFTHSNEENTRSTKQKDARIKSPGLKSPTPTKTPPRVYRIQSQDRNDPDKKGRSRNLSGVFGELDLAAEDGKPRSRRQSLVYLPEGCVRQWMAEIVVAITRLHAMGILCKDLRPANILLGERGHILLTYFSQWPSIEKTIDQSAIENCYCAPEVTSVHNVGESCDWWSVGVLLFELLTGKNLSSCYPSGLTSHTALVIPDHVSPEATSLLQELLRYNPQERLGSVEIKLHPFFADIDWDMLQS